MTDFYMKRNIGLIRLNINDNALPSIKKTGFDSYILAIS